MQKGTGAARLLVVGPEGSARSAVVALAVEHGWEWESAQSAPQAIRRLRTRADIDVVTLAPTDARGLRDAVELCRTVKFDQRTRLVSVVCLLPAVQVDRRVELYESGADDCIDPDAPPREIRLRLEKAVRVKHVTDTLDDADAIVMTLANAVEGKDEYTLGHVDRVSTYAVEIGRRLGIDSEGLAALKLGAVVHDIGKVGIPDPILKKPGKLTDEEMQIMRRHPLIGYEILKPLRTFKDVLPIVRWHHERPNGTGYPDRLKGDELPMLPRIISVADVFDALSTDRPYRKALPLEQCASILLEEREKGNLDDTVVRTLLEILSAGNPGGQAGLPTQAA
jgi:putative two-component system response regulator